MMWRALTKKKSGLGNSRWILGSGSIQTDSWSTVCLQSRAEGKSILHKDLEEATETSCFVLLCYLPRVWSRKSCSWWSKWRRVSKAGKQTSRSSDIARSRFGSQEYRWLCCGRSSRLRGRQVFWTTLQQLLAHLGSRTWELLFLRFQSIFLLLHFSLCRSSHQTLSQSPSEGLLLKRQ